MDNFIGQLLAEQPYFKDPKKTFTRALDLLVESGESAPGIGTLLGGYIFFYGISSKFTDIEAVSSTLFSAFSQANEDVETYDQKRIAVPFGSLIHDLGENPRPIFVHMSLMEGKISNEMFEFPGASPISLELNETLGVAAKLFLRESDSIVLAAVPLGILSLRNPVENDYIFEKMNAGRLVGYAILFVRSDISSMASGFQEEIVTVERVLQILWLIGNSKEEFHLFKYERKAREEFMGEVMHRWVVTNGPPLDVLEQLKAKAESGNREALLECAERRLPKTNIELARSFYNEFDRFLTEKGPVLVDVGEFCRKLAKDFEEQYETQVLIEETVSRRALILESEFAFCIRELLYNANKRATKMPIRLLLRELDDVSRDLVLQNVYVDDRQQMQSVFFRIVVENEGRGVDPRFKEKIFEAHVQLNPHEDKDRVIYSKKRGMGLFLVRRYIQEHFGGFIFEHGEFLENARFTIILKAEGTVT